MNKQPKNLSTFELLDLSKNTRLGITKVGAARLLKSDHNYKRIIAIGDIHGCLDSLKYHIEHLSPTEDDLLIFLGDYIDRGPDSPGTIDYLLELKSHANCFFLRGNHDSMMLSFLNIGGIYGEAFTYGGNGGKTTLDQYKARPLFSAPCIGYNIPMDHVSFLDDTKLFLEMDKFFYSHAGFDTFAFEPYDSQHEEDYTWTRENFLGVTHTNKLDKIVVHGHTINYDTLLPSWDVELKKINLDSGSFISGNISSLTYVPEIDGAFMSVSNFQEKFFDDKRGPKA